MSDLRSSGVGLLHNVFDPAEVEDARRVVLANLHLMRNTRPNPSSRHVAGFHRYPDLEPLHGLITGARRIRDTITELLGPDHRTIGLSDITIDRSQQWHKDLLRGPFSRHLEAGGNCAAHHGKVFKVLVYLQDSSSLRIVPGSHLRDVPLDSDDHARPGADDRVRTVEVRTGDAVVLDICTTHRGASEDELGRTGPSGRPRILLSTAFGRVGCEFSDRMELGITERLIDWQRRNG